MLADDLLDDVLHRHDARPPAVLVDDDGQLHARLLHLAQQVVDALGLRGVRRRAASGRGRRGRAPRLQRSMAVTTPDHVEHAVGVDRDARESALLDERTASSGVAVGGSATTSTSGTMTSRAVGLAEVEDLVDHLGLGRVTSASSGSIWRRQLQLLARDELPRAGRAPPEERAARRPRSCVAHVSGDRAASRAR
jgi:hypothetical protein